jgi:hypothetical protein
MIESFFADIIEGKDGSRSARDKGTACHRLQTSETPVDDNAQREPWFS